ncbi:hypothetical protein SNE35_05830 [Paucibacter sp. R3-3]|uniref:Uncharacterized protein n=1 Tax=Roseateles agri TaxID=3098619 RepID=A0ABU5DFT5_9BURK|nr:hypothetical protein [Paucibacter sp. R3-3]MDY0744012.1 hypothetical protein [Paucibacter sp. R3-3]
MPIKTVAVYATEVSKMSFAEIKKDNTLFNAVNKALTKGLAKEQFSYLNEKNRDPEHLYTKFVKDNDVNIASSLQKELADAIKAEDKSKAKKAVGKIDDECESLLKTNIRPKIVDDVSFKTWVEQQNEPEIKKIAARNASADSKRLGIKDKDLLETAIASMLRGDKADSLKALTKLAKEEQLKDKAADILSALEKAGLA